MDDFTLPSVGASFKKWKFCTPILPKGMAQSSNFSKKKFKKIQNIQKKASLTRQELAGGCPNLTFCTIKNILHALHFLRMWIILVGWLQHIPALPRLFSKNFKHP
jgi:hypothetical protein